MLVITIEYWPGGDEKQKEEIAWGRITNNGGGCEEYGCYDVSFSTGKPSPEGTTPVVKGNVDFFRRKKDKVWKLVYRALKNSFGIEYLEG